MNLKFPILNNKKFFIFELANNHNGSFEEAKKLLITLLNNLVNSKKAPVEIKKIHDIMDEFNKNYDEKVLINGKRGAGRKWLKFEKDKMRVIIGVRDNCALTRVQGYGCQGTQKEQAKLRSNLSQ